jgi:hypothetical protein
VHNKKNFIYLFKLLLFCVLSISHDFVHVSLTIFTILFVIIEICMIILDVLIYKRIKIKIEPLDIGIYILYNYVALKVIFLHN